MANACFMVREERSTSCHQLQNKSQFELGKDRERSVEQQRGLANMTTQLYNVMQPLSSGCVVSTQEFVIAVNMQWKRDVSNLVKTWIEKVRAAALLPVVGIHTRVHTHKEVVTTSLWFKSMFTLA